MDSIIIKEIPTENLTPYFQPEEVWGYCQNCPRYGKFWSCPSHSFDVPDYINQFRNASIIGIKIPVDSGSTSEEQIELFHSERKRVNNALLLLEKEIPNTLTLIAGHCHYCNELCTREEGLPCKSPEKLRFSLESLGYKVSDITTSLLGEKLQWSKEKENSPNHLLAVFAFLSKESIGKEVIMSALQ